MEEYRSPFLLPECTNPEDHNYYPNMHASRSNERCHVHYDGKKVEPQAKEWLKWAAYREAYATIEPGLHLDNYFLDKMLGTVTLDNPPYAPSEPPSGPTRKSIGDIHLEEIAIKAWEWVNTPQGISITIAIWIIPLMLAIVLSGN